MNKQTYIRTLSLAAATAVLALLLLLTQTASAQVKSFFWDRFDVEMTLQENGDIRVVERQTLVFSGAPFTFGFATIPTGSAGNNDGITDIAVSEGNVVYRESSSGAPGTYEVSRSGDEVRIDWYFEPALGERTYTFTYTIEGGVIVGTSEPGDGDQIFWKAIPPDIPGRVLNSITTIRLPEGVQPQQYTGTTDYLVGGTLNGDTNAVRTQVSDDGRTISYTLLQPMNTGDLYEVRVQWPHGILDIPTPDWQQRQQRADVISLVIVAFAILLLVVGPLLVLALWYTRGRDPQLSVIVPETLSAPPDNLPPAVAGTLVDEKADMRDIISTLVDLANRGHITISEQKRDHVFRLTGQPLDDLSRFERQFVKDVFRGKEERELSSLRYKFASKLPRLRRLLYEELESRGFVPKSPESIRNRYTVFGWLLLIGAFIVGFLGALVNIGAALSCIPIAVGVTAVTLLITARFMPAKTAKGAEAAAKWVAFKNYLQNIEQHANLEEASAIFEQYLPYATAFGLERSWIRKFSKVSATPIPGWYYPVGMPYPRRPFTTASGAPTGGGEFSGGAPSLETLSGGVTGGLESMSQGLTRMLNSTATTLRSTPPSSSSSSGSFSGGFSGGFSSGGGGSRGFG